MTYMTASTLMTMDTDGQLEDSHDSHEQLQEPSGETREPSASKSSESYRLRLVVSEPGPLNVSVSAEALGGDRDESPLTPLVSEEELSDETSSWMSGGVESELRPAQVCARPKLDNNNTGCSGTTEYDSTTSSYSSAGGLFEACKHELTEEVSVDFEE